MEMSTLTFQSVLVETDDHFDSVKKEEEEKKQPAFWKETMMLQKKTELVATLMDYD